MKKPEHIKNWESDIDWAITHHMEEMDYQVEGKDDLGNTYVGVGHYLHGELVFIHGEDSVYGEPEATVINYD